MACQWSVKELREMLEGEPDDAIIFAIWHDESGKFNERPIYKNSTSEDDSEHYLYLGDERNYTAEITGRSPQDFEQ